MHVNKPKYSSLQQSHEGACNYRAIQIYHAVNFQTRKLDVHSSVRMMTQKSMCSMITSEKRARGKKLHIALT